MRPIIFSVFIFMAAMASAQSPDETAIKLSIQELFDAMKAGNSVVAKQLFDESAVLHTVNTDKDGISWIESEPVDSFLQNIARIKTGAMQIEERMKTCEVKIDSAMANAWVQYEFYIKGRLSHYGVDVFQLYKSHNGWKIIYICDTRHRARN